MSLLYASNQCRRLQRKEILLEDETNIASVYKTIWSISQLKSRFFPSTVGLRHVADLLLQVFDPSSRST